MSENLLLGLIGILFLGFLSEWLAWKLHFPAILLLLVSGFIVGPVTGWIDPDALLGNLLYPFISMSVAIILFEGSLNLSFRELKANARPIVNLVTIGAIVTWVLIAFNAYGLLHLRLDFSVLLGAILVVSGPTVVLPMLRQIRLRGKSESILKWEGITIDPIGALLAILVYEFILAEGIHQAATLVLGIIFKTFFFGPLSGAITTLFLILSIRRYWIPDFLQSTFTLFMVGGTFALSNHFLNESAGFLAVITMGIILANQRWISIKPIVHFKENLRVLLLSGVFIILAARLPIGDLSYVNLQSFIFLGVILFLIRPLAVLLSTSNVGLLGKERFFLSMIAPRGIVAAAVASIFALRLEEKGFPEADILISMTFFVIVGTVFFYSLASPWIARFLKLSALNPQGLLLMGAHLWIRDLAKILKQEGFQVVLVDTNYHNVRLAMRDGLTAYHGNVYDEDFLSQIDLSGVGYFLALTQNDEANSLASLHCRPIFGGQKTYQLSLLNEDKDDMQQPVYGRFLFGPTYTYNYLVQIYNLGGQFKVTKITQDFNFDNYQSFYGNKFIPLFLITDNKDLIIWTGKGNVQVKPGYSVVSLTMNEETKK